MNRLKDRPPPGQARVGPKAFEAGVGSAKTKDTTPADEYDELDAEQDAYAFADLHRDIPITNLDCLTIASVAMERMTEGFFGAPVQFGEDIARVLFACLERAGVTLTVAARPPQRPRTSANADTGKFVDWDEFWTTP